jgi:PKD repeat protein
MKALIVIFLVLAGLLQSTVISDFTINVDGWLSEGDGQYQWEAVLGNPGGCFRVDDDATGDMNRAYAPHKFLGSWQNAAETDYISADVKVSQASGSYVGTNYVFRIQGPGGLATAIINPTPPTEIWVPYSVAIKASEWVVLEGTFEAILQHVNSLVVTAEYINGDEIVRLDNIELSFDPVSLPVQNGTISDFEQVGYDGWTFVNHNGVNDEASGGNPGRYIKVNDGSGFAEGIAPAKFLGSWENIVDDCAIMVDLKKFTTNSDWNSPIYFLKISGTGGSAICPVSNTRNLPYNEWTTLSIPIQESEFIQVTGDWESLMADVTEMRLAFDYYASNETLGMDNFRITNSLPEVDFSANETALFAGDYISFTDLTTNDPYQWFWNFGDDNSAIIKNPIHQFINEGLYHISLTATNVNGSNSLTKENFIHVYASDGDFHDDFEDGEILDLWQQIRGTWSEHDGALYQTSNDYTSNQFQMGCYQLVGSETWQNYEISTIIRSYDNDGIGLALNFQDINNFYLFNWNADDYLERAIYKYVDGVETQLITEASSFVTGQEYAVDFSYRYGQIVLRIDGIEIFNIFDTSLENGKAGAWCWANTGARWYDFKVTFMPEKPENLSIEIQPTQVHLTWSEVVGAVSYSVYSMNEPNDWENAELEAENVLGLEWNGEKSDTKKFYYVIAVK